MGLKGILIGSVVGVTFGPVGAYVGGFLGGLIEDYSKSEESFSCPHCNVAIDVQKGFFYCNQCNNLIYYQIDDLSNYSSSEIFNLSIFCIFSLFAKLSTTLKQDQIVESFATTYLELTVDEKRNALNILKQSKHIDVKPEIFLNLLSVVINDNESFCAELIDKFYQIASVRAITQSEEDFILTASQTLNISTRAYLDIKENYDFSKYYEILKCKQTDSFATVKNQYRTLIKEFHPDTLRSKGLPESIISMAEQKTQELTNAYEKVRILF